ncbi:MAG: hypothetical protein ACTIK0_06525 [Ruoffia tabacinasalis]
MQKIFLKVLLGTVLLGNMPIHSWVQAEEIPEDIPQIQITEEAVATENNIVKLIMSVQLGLIMETTLNRMKKDMPTICMQIQIFLQKSSR